MEVHAQQLSGTMDENYERYGTITRTFRTTYVSGTLRYQLCRKETVGTCPVNVIKFEQFVMYGWKGIAQRTYMQYVASMHSCWLAAIQVNGGLRRNM